MEMNASISVNKDLLEIVLRKDHIFSAEQAEAKEAEFKFKPETIRRDRGGRGQSICRL